MPACPITHSWSALPTQRSDSLSGLLVPQDRTGTQPGSLAPDTMPHGVTGFPRALPQPLGLLDLPSCPVPDTQGTGRNCAKLKAQFWKTPMELRCSGCAAAQETGQMSWEVSRPQHTQFHSSASSVLLTTPDLYHSTRCPVRKGHSPTSLLRSTDLSCP